MREKHRRCLGWQPDDHRKTIFDEKIKKGGILP